ncbi:MAG: phage antirepressor KilAC domain-containing protein [Halopseudomonas sp.]|uniref:phage antirepressor KilAC domain-containing protein n=1 Tax=Halopseudomonas sp. TaxID=2901191 RepID=UPI0030015DF1
MIRDLQKAARQLGTTRPKLIAAMKEAGLLNAQNLPAHPLRDRFYLQVKRGSWYHETLGMQYSESTRVTQAGINWLADKLGLERPPVPEDNRGVA